MNKTRFLTHVGEMNKSEFPAHVGETNKSEFLTHVEGMNKTEFPTQVGEGLKRGRICTGHRVHFRIAPLSES